MSVTRKLPRNPSGLTRRQYERLTKCACGHARYEHAKNSLTGHRCYFCDCDGWFPPQRSQQ